MEHVDDLMCSEKTLYNYVDAQLFEIRNIDLPRKVKYRPRYKQPEFKVDGGCRLERSYSDFKKFLDLDSMRLFLVFSAFYVQNYTKYVLD